jgi:hypothetical protein
MGNINIAGQSLHFNQQQDDNDDEELPPLEHIWDCPYIVKNPPTGWKCLWCSGVFVPVHATRALYHVNRIKGGVLSLVRLPFQQTIWHDIRQ